MIISKSPYITRIYILEWDLVDTEYTPDGGGGTAIDWIKSSLYREANVNDRNVTNAVLLRRREKLEMLQFRCCTLNHGVVSFQYKASDSDWTWILCL